MMTQVEGPRSALSQVSVRRGSPTVTVTSASWSRRASGRCSTMNSTSKPGSRISSSILPDHDTMSMSGRRFASYTMGERVGAGGMGEVYRARDTRLGRDVAVKLLSPTFTADRERLARFEREARLLAALNHPNVGAIYGIEDLDGEPALVLEWIGGETLAERLARGPMPPGDAWPIARQIALALEAA